MSNTTTQVTKKRKTKEKKENKEDEKWLDDLRAKVNSWMKSRTNWFEYNGKHFETGDSNAAAPLEFLKKLPKRTKIDNYHLMLQHTRLSKDNKDKFGVHIQQIAVSPYLRRNGHATKILQIIEEEAQKNSWNYVFVESVLGDGMSTLMKKMCNKHSYELYLTQNDYVHWF